MTTEDDYSDEDLSERAARLLGAAATGSPGGDLTVALDELERYCDMVGTALVHLKRVTRERDEARAEAERLRRLALVPMAAGEVPTEPGWYVAQIRRSSRPESVELEHAAAPIGAPSVVWAAGEAMPFEAGDVHRWLARIPVEALGEVADG